MKIYKIFALAGLMLTALVGCDETEPIIFDGEAVKFDQTSFSTSVPTTDLELTIPISSTIVTDADRTFQIEVVSADNADEFTIGEARIPANQYDGTATVNFDFSAITGNDGDLKTAELRLIPVGNTQVFSETVVIEYFRAIVCNDVTFFIQADRYGGETGFRVEDANGTAVYTMPAGSISTVGAGVAPTTYTANFNLPDGCYTAVITDSYGDGQVDGANPNGFYEITCSIATLATGGGAFMGEERTNFCVNQ